MTGKKKRTAAKPASVTFCSYPKLVYSWPLVLMGLLFYWVAPPDAPEALLATLGWIYLGVTVLVVLTIGLDFERNLAFFWLMVFGLFFFLGRWLEDAKGFSFFGNIYAFFSVLHVSYSRGAGMAIAVLLAFPYLLMLLWARIQNRWRITHNEFEHFSWGRADDSLARGAKRVRTTYPDVLELLLAGSGTLIVYSATGRTELRRINNVILLPLLRRRISRILAEFAVTTSSKEAIVDEEMETEHEEESSSPEESEAGAEERERL